jgi:hypothetical protein
MSEDNKKYQLTEIKRSAYATFGKPAQIIQLIESVDGDIWAVFGGTWYPEVAIGGIVKYYYGEQDGNEALLIVKEIIEDFKSKPNASWE